jgi:hypothetical protein
MQLDDVSQNVLQNESVGITNKMQPCNRICYSKIYWRLNMFRAAHRSSSGVPNCICSLWFIYPCGDRPLSRLGGNCSSHPAWTTWPITLVPTYQTTRWTVTLVPIYQTTRWSITLVPIYQTTRWPIMLVHIYQTTQRHPADRRKGILRENIEFHIYFTWFHNFRANLYSPDLPLIKPALVLRFVSWNRWNLWLQTWNHRPPVGGKRCNFSDTFACRWV